MKRSVLRVISSAAMAYICARLWFDDGMTARAIVGFALTYGLSLLLVALVSNSPERNKP